jgi:hypothetical protein
MAFCPKCKCEYQPGFIRCSDCDMELVEILSEENDEKPNCDKLELVLLATFPNPMEAQMFQELLESNGIVSMLQSDFNAGAGTFTASPNAVLVQEIDFQKGRELYEQYFGGDPLKNRESYPEGHDEGV